MHMCRNKSTPTQCVIHQTACVTWCTEPVLHVLVWILAIPITVIGYSSTAGESKLKPSLDECS